ncbi:MAG TPA: ATP-binding protein, partial [Lacipirellulaceae bacterium]|nr:ATP-binding protein [Lacipirellulaceae bacterium]
FFSALISNYLFTDSIWITSNEEALELCCFVLLSLIIAGLSEISVRALSRAQQAEREKDNFMAAVAHEMRSPLSVIYYANSMNRIAGNQPMGDQLDTIDRQVHHLNLMIEDLLDVSRVARGKVKLNLRPSKLSSIVAAAVERATPLINNHRHLLKIQLPPDDVELCVDSRRIEQVLTNLLTNAAKYTPDGGEIVVRAGVIDSQATLSVRDNGIGIASNAMPTIFELFFQADAARDRAEGGLGIGLALSRKIVQMHSGSLRATSAGKNRGSEFVVSLPVQQPATQQLSLASV